MNNTTRRWNAKNAGLDQLDHYRSIDYFCFEVGYLGGQEEKSN